MAHPRATGLRGQLGKEACSSTDDQVFDHFPRSVAADRSPPNPRNCRRTGYCGARYLNDYGCQADHRYPNFHLVKGCCCLSRPTWVCLDEYYEFKDSELLQRHFSGDVNRIGELPDVITIELMECALSADDISGRQAGIVRNALDEYRK